jgi:hypothetical protein
MHEYNIVLIMFNQSFTGDLHFELICTCRFYILYSSVGQAFFIATTDEVIVFGLKTKSP